MQGPQGVSVSAVPAQQREVSNVGWRTWHSESDIPQRKALVNHIYNLFSKRKPTVTQEWQTKLPDFVRRLEEALYRNAASQEEYADITTLEHRLQNVARSMVGRNPPQQQQGARPPHQLQSQSNGFPLGSIPGGYQNANFAGAVQPLMQQVAGQNGALAGSMPTSTPADLNQAPATMGYQQNQMYTSNGFNTSLSGTAGRLGTGSVGNHLLSSPAFPSGEAGLGQMSMSSLQQTSQQQAAHSSLARNGLTGGGVMSNGAPVLLRGNNNSSGTWNSAQAALINPTASAQGGDRMMMNGMVPPNHQGQASMAQQHAGLQQHRPPLQGNMMPVQNGMIPVAHSQQMSNMVGMNPLMRQQHQQMGPAAGGAGMMVPVGNSASNSPALPPALQAMPMPSIPTGGLESSNSQGFLPQTPNVGEGQSQPAMNPNDPDYQKKKEYILKQQRWLLFLRHCAKCTLPDGTCNYGSSCTVAKQLWRHILNCGDPGCQYPRCVTSRELLKHHQKCQSEKCPVCAPVKAYVQRQRNEMQKQQQKLQQEQGLLMQQQQQAQQGMLDRSRSYTQMMAQGGMQQGHNHLHHHALMNGNQAAPTMMVPVAQQNGDAEERLPPAKRPRRAMMENQGTSLLEAFSAEEIRNHLRELRQSGHLALPGGKGKVHPDLFNQIDQLEHPIDKPIEDENLCKVCGQNRLTFEPPSIYCTCCGQKIKRNQIYYSTPVRKSDVKGYWCHSCFSEHKGEKIDVDGTHLVRKAELEKRKNDEEMEEGWVQCDQCNGWVHQICGFFNKGRNDEEIPYHCPHCLLQGLESGRREPIKIRPQAMLEARDLPKTDLSNKLEERLVRALAVERDARAKLQGRHVSEVPTAEGLTIRVINNVQKKMEVKTQFYNAFKDELYPDSFSYTQKVIVLFQKLGGVDVCLFCIYVQEYGDDASLPNRKWVYLSYLDSIKYFQPDVMAFQADSMEAAGKGGMALRTYVYHEIMIGYLDYIKQRGFTSMFIWACPPLQGDDYILYCHPLRQKTPRSDRLREWYLTLLRKAKDEGIVSYISNLFDTFFEGGKDHRMDKPSATHLPYFEGDYWPGEAENLLNNMGEEQRRDGKKGKKAGKVRSKGSKGKRFGGGTGSIDEQLMSRLGDVIQGMKEDFIVVHLREPCSFCREYISGAPKYYHPAPPSKTIKQERTFEGISLETPGAASGTKITPLSRLQLCPSCYSKEHTAFMSGTRGSRGLPAGISIQELQSEKVEEIPATMDPNAGMENEFFDTRQAFLSLCQGNHYQFDTIRRAKHSSMMVLYHLHNPHAPAFACSCNHCGAEIEPGQGWRCSQCQDFDVCQNCKANPSFQHQHPLLPHARKIDETRTRLTVDEKRERANQLQRTMQLLVHASACQLDNCPSSNCQKVKQLYQHAIVCQKRVMGGCPLCKRMWALLQLHAKQCTVMNCPVPRCRELREVRRRQATRQEEQRRVAYKAMLRNQEQARQQEQQQQQQHQYYQHPPQQLAQHAY